MSKHFRLYCCRMTTLSHPDPSYRYGYRLIHTGSAYSRYAIRVQIDIIADTCMPYSCDTNYKDPSQCVTFSNYIILANYPQLDEENSPDDL